SWDLDRLYALTASAGGPTPGVAITRPEALSGKSLKLNFLTRPAKRSSIPGLDEGSITVELLDGAGQPVSGFTAAECAPLRGDHRAKRVTWSGGAIAPTDAKQAKFTFKRAFLYGFDLSQ